MIVVTDQVDSLKVDQLGGGFFESWPNPPSPETHLRILRGSYAAFIALDGDQVVGFITAISDGVLAAFIPNLEVLPSYRGKGIGTRLVEAMKERLADFSAVDLVCDEDVKPFYADLGFRECAAMIIRNFEQSGRP